MLLGLVTLCRAQRLVEDVGFTGIYCMDSGEILYPHPALSSLVPTGLTLTEKAVLVVWLWGKDPKSQLWFPASLEGRPASDNHCLDIALLGQIRPVLA